MRDLKEANASSALSSPLHLRGTFLKEPHPGASPLITTVNSDGPLCVFSIDQYMRYHKYVYV